MTTKDLIRRPITTLRGRNRQIKAIARALVFTDAYYQLPSDLRYTTAEQLYQHGVRIDRKTQHFKGP